MVLLVSIHEGDIAGFVYALSDNELAINNCVCNSLAREEVEYEKCVGSSCTRKSQALTHVVNDSVFALI